MSSDKNTRHIPEFGGIIDEFKQSFNWKLAEKDGIIEPSQGHDHEFDENELKIRENTSALNDILDEIHREYKSINIKWAHKKGKVSNSFQIEVPKALHRL